MCSMKWARPGVARAPGATRRARTRRPTSERVPGSRAEMTRGPSGSSGALEHRRECYTGVPARPGGEPGARTVRSAGRLARVRQSVPSARPSSGSPSVRRSALHRSRRPRAPSGCTAARVEAQRCLDRASSLGAVDRGRELQHHPLVALDQRVGDELVGPRLELEVLPGVDVDADRERREERRDSGRSATIRSTQPVPWLTSVGPASSGRRRSA